MFLLKHSGEIQEIRLKIKRRDGFTLVELLFVIAIIGVLAAIAIPSLRSYMQRSYDSSAVSDLKNAYSAAQIYFNDYPSDTVAPASLEQYGFRSTPKVILTILDGSIDGLNLTASHEGSSKTYSVDSEGSISSD